MPLNGRARYGETEMEKKVCKIEPINCKCGAVPCVVVCEFTAKVLCPECWCSTTRRTREHTVKSWNKRMEKEQKKAAKWKLKKILEEWCMAVEEDNLDYMLEINVLRGE